MNLKQITAGIIIFLFLSGCSVFQPATQKKAEEKMDFSFSKLDKKGLIKKRGTSLAYEFCIPNESEYLDKIKSIDQTIAIYKSSTGRIGCGENQILCIGETMDKNYKEIIIALTNLPYVKNINESFFE